jgi:hypothetical protein
LKQKQKDEKEIRRFVEDCISRVEYKFKEEQEIIEKFMRVQSNGTNSPISD